jgi:hypothetical protein
MALRAEGEDALCLVELRGFEPLTPCMPSSDPDKAPYTPQPQATQAASPVTPGEQATKAGIRAVKIASRAR